MSATKPYTPAPTLESYLADCMARGLIDHALRASQDVDGNIRFYLHPLDADGATPQFQVAGNSVVLDDGLSTLGVSDVVAAEVQAYSTNELPDAD